MGKLTKVLFFYPTKITAIYTVYIIVITCMSMSATSSLLARYYLHIPHTPETKCLAESSHYLKYWMEAGLRS